MTEHPELSLYEENLEKRLAEMERLEAALREIQAFRPDCELLEVEMMREIARKALEGNE